MRILSNTNYQTISYKSKLTSKLPKTPTKEKLVKNNLTWRKFKENAKKNLPLTLMTIGLVIPVPFASVAGLALGTVIVKIQKMFNKTKPS